MTEALPHRIDATAAAALWRAGAILIDVRSPAGRAKNGELVGAVIVPKTDVVEFVANRLAGRRQPVVLFCGSVAGSEPLVSALVAAELPRVADVEGGFPALVATGAFTVTPPPG